MTLNKRNKINVRKYKKKITSDNFWQDDQKCIPEITTITKKYILNHLLKDKHFYIVFLGEVIQVCSHEVPRPFPREDDNEIEKIH